MMALHILFIVSNFTILEQWITCPDQQLRDIQVFNVSIDGESCPHNADFVGGITTNFQAKNTLILDTPTQNGLST